MKTELIDGIGTIVEIGSSCVGCMSWETPYILLKINGIKLRYQSDLLETDRRWFEKLNTNNRFRLKLRYRQVFDRNYDGKVWRILNIEFLDF